MNLKNVTRLLASFYESLDESELTSKEEEYARQLQELINRKSVFETTNDLDFESEEENEAEIDFRQTYADVVSSNESDSSDSEDLISSQESKASSSSSYLPSSSPVRIARKLSKTTIPLERIKEIVSFSTKTDGSWRSSSTVTTRFRTEFKNCSTDVTVKRKLNRFKNQLEKQGSRIEKLKSIHYQVLKEFKEAKEQLKIVHDRDIQKWGYFAAKQIGMNTFKSSRTWVNNFKTANRITSRKITRTVSTKQIHESDDLNRKASDFIFKIKNLMDSFGSNIYNTDQSGFNYEMHAGRTLDFKGIKQVTASVQSISATSHSYTIQPLIKCDGTLHDKLLLCLQELNGFPRTKTPLIAPNIYLKCSTSGKLTKDILKEWFEDIFIPDIQSNRDLKGLLLHDSWKGFSNLNLNHSNDIELSLQVIPPKTTSIIQPLDVYFFRPWKVFVRIISDYIIFMNIDISLQQNNNVIKLQSLTHFQFTSEKFKPMIQYSWFKSGYYDQRPASFKTPSQYCFDYNMIEKQCLDCLTQGTQMIPFARCAHCEEFFCFNHFFGTDPNIFDSHLCYG